MIITIIAAKSKNNVISRDNALPWHLPKDLKYFKRTTMGEYLIMGRNTYESVKGLLPGRKLLVVSRILSQAEMIADAFVFSSLDKAFDHAWNQQVKRVFVAGGAQLYSQVIPYAHELLLTQVDAWIEGDSYFPYFDQENYFCETLEEVPAEALRPAFKFMRYSRLPKY